MNEVQLLRVLQAPIVSEKSTRLADEQHQVVFRVDSSATKEDVRQAVELAFKVEVASVRVLNVVGKNKRFGRFIGKRSDWKKAYVNLKPGFDIEFAA